MFKSVKDLKAFIVWCKEQKIKRFSAEGVEVEMSELAYAMDITEDTKDPISSQPSSKLLVETEPKNEIPIEEDPDLFYSSN